jgi:hypothetical protein
MMEEEQAPAWFTDMQRGDFKVGDEVVVTLGECMIGAHHGLQEEGARGTVIGLNSIDEGHPIAVSFRQPLPVNGGRFWTYAPAELRHFDLMAHIAAIAAQAS